MKERPILFSGAMVRAILDGRKTQTRRLLRPQPSSDDIDNAGDCKTVIDMVTGRYITCPYGVVGDRLWVRETWAGVRIGRHSPVFYRASCEDDACDFVDPSDGSIQRVKIAKWRPGIFLPHGAHRITLEITEVRVQRLQEISEDDARAEGVERDTSPCDHTRLSCDEIGCLGPTYRSTFYELWDTINGKRATWASNPWVWCLTFRRAA